MAVNGAAAAKEALRDHVEPVVDAVEENIRQAQRVIGAGRQTAEELAAEAVEQARKHPLGAIVVAVGIGAALGCLVGLGLGWGRRRSR